MPQPSEIDDPDPDKDHGKAEKLAHGKRSQNQPELSVRFPKHFNHEPHCPIPD